MLDADSPVDETALSIDDVIEAVAKLKCGNISAVLKAEVRP